MNWLGALDLLFWTALFLLLWLGGWLLAAHVLDLRRRERLPAGLGISVLLFIVLASLWGQALPVPAAFWAAGGTVLAAGLAAARLSKRRPLLDRADLQAWPLVLALFGLALFFASINRGLAIFDDYHNLPLVSTLAAGPASGPGLPPNYFLNTSDRLAYHFGLHLFSASMVRIGGLTPWSAYDLSKSFSLALAAILGWIWFRRVTRSRTAAYLGAALAALAGGSRWLLLLVPSAWLERASAGLALLGSAAQSGPGLAANLRGPWSLDGDGPLPFPFAFANGIFPPQVMALGGSAALPVATLFLLLLVTRQSRATRRRLTPAAAVMGGLLLASLALTAEHLFVLLWGGVLLATIAGALRRRRRTSSLNRGAPGGWAAQASLGLLLAVSAGVAAIEGGVITEILRGQLAHLGAGSNSSSAGFTAFAVRWPPGLISSHLGYLNLADPGQILIGLAEIGVALTLAPWVSWWCWKRLKQGDWLVAGLGAAALGGFLIPLFINYVDRERDITRLAAAALFIWVILGFPLAWFAYKRGGAWLRIGLGAGYALLVLGGIALLSIQALAIPRPQNSVFVKEADALLSRQLWNRLEPGAQVLDSVPHRAVTLFGLGGGRAHSDPYTPFPEWRALITDPDPAAIARAGYTYVYLDRRWWESMTGKQHELFQNPCVHIIAEEAGEDGDFRRLLEVRSCRGD